MNQLHPTFHVTRVVIPSFLQLLFQKLWRNPFLISLHLQLPSIHNPKVNVSLLRKNNTSSSQSFGHSSQSASILSTVRSKWFLSVWNEAILNWLSWLGKLCNPKTLLRIIQTWLILSNFIITTNSSSLYSLKSFNYPLKLSAFVSSSFPLTPAPPRVLQTPIIYVNVAPSTCLIIASRATTAPIIIMIRKAHNYKTASKMLWPRVSTIVNMNFLTSMNHNLLLNGSRVNFFFFKNSSSSKILLLCQFQK